MASPEEMRGSISSAGLSEIERRWIQPEINLRYHHNYRFMDDPLVYEYLGRVVGNPKERPLQQCLRDGSFEIVPEGQRVILDTIIIIDPKTLKTTEKDVEAEYLHVFRTGDSYLLTNGSKGFKEVKRRKFFR